MLAVDKLGSLFIFCMNTGELIASKKLTQAPIVQICAVLGRCATASHFAPSPACLLTPLAG